MKLLIPVVAIGLMLLSALNAERVVAVDYEAVNYGYPLPWLVHYLAGIAPVNLWLPNVAGVLVDYAVWIVVSALLIATASLLQRESQPVQSTR